MQYFKEKSEKIATWSLVSFQSFLFSLLYSLTLNMPKLYIIISLREDFKSLGTLSFKGGVRPENFC